jgi:RNA polymerase sigma-70 factor (sigma-E family)
MDDDLVDFCRQEHARLVATLDLMCGSLPLAEDLAQETLARVCQNWSRIRTMEAPGAYAHRIAVNLATSTFRRRAAERRAQARERAAWVQEEAPEPDPAAAVAVRDALQRIRPEQRQVLVLRYFLGYSVAEVAEVLGSPLGTVKTHAHRGLAALRELLDTALPSEEVLCDG